MCMDSRSGPEVPSKVHAFREAVKRTFRKRRETLTHWVRIGGGCAVILAGCSPDLREPAGVLGVVAEGCANNDARALFPALDERSRHALDAIVKGRKKAEALINESYPKEAQSEARSQLGDAIQVENGAALFALRCQGKCLEELCKGVGAPTSQQSQGDTLTVQTVRGGSYTLQRANDGRYGFVWHTDELVRERRRAFAELSSTENNAKVYKQQGALR